MKATCDEPERVPRPGVEVVRIVDQHDNRVLLAAATSKLSVPASTSRRWPGSGSPSPSAPRRARACTAGITSSPARTGASSWCSPENGRSDSAGTPCAESTRHAVCVCGDLLEQFALADPSFAAHHERPTAAVASFLEQLSDASSLGDPSDEHGKGDPMHSVGGHKPPLPDMVVVNHRE